MANLRTDTPTSRRIVRAFLDFLDSVEPAPGVDLEGLEVAKDCLTEVFRLHELPESEQPELNLLLNTFSSVKVSPESVPKSEEAQTGPSAQNSAAGDFPGTSKVQGDIGVSENNDTGVSKDELFGQFFDALEKIRFFRTTPNGDDDHVLLDRATCLFHDAVSEMERSGCKILNRKNLADALKILGNNSMQSNHSDAVERYTCAIALCENAVYYCNRAAAYTQMHRYNEAIKDCLKAIEIDPNYSKAYSRLGLAYYAQGKYSDAINKGFRKALELDPNNDAVKENIWVAEQKLNAEQEQRCRYQDSRNYFGRTSGDQGAAPPPFSSVSFDPSTLPANFANMFANMAGNVSQNQNRQRSPAEENHGTHFPFASGNFDSNAIPVDIASMFMNMAGSGSTFQGQGAQSQSRSAEQNHENGANPFSNFANMFMNMAGNGSQGQSSQGQPQGNTNAGDDPGIGLGGGGGGTSFSFNFNEPEELSTTLRSMMGLFSGEPQGEPQNNNGDGRSASR